MWSSVDKAQGGIVVPRGGEDLSEPPRLGRTGTTGASASRESAQAAALACGSRSHNECRVPGELGGHGQVECQGRFPHAALL